MSGPDSGGYSVIAAEEQLPPRSVIADFFRVEYEITFDEAVQRARHCWGFLGEHLSREKADSVASSCASSEIKVIVVPDPVPLPQPKKVSSCRLAENGVEFVVGDGIAEEFPFGVLRAVVAAPVREEQIKREVTVEGPSVAGKAVRLGILAFSGIPLPPGAKKETVKEIKMVDADYRMDIFLPAPYSRLRITASNFNFSCLGPEMTYSSQTNFCLLCGMLSPKLSEGTIRNEGFRAICEKRPLAASGYDSVLDFDKDALRVFTLSQLNADKR